MHLQSWACAAKGVGRDRLSPRSHVAAENLFYDICVFDIPKFWRTAIDETSVLQLGSHRPVEYERT
jgi:hypothetical protein